MVLTNQKRVLCSDVTVLYIQFIEKTLLILLLLFVKINIIINIYSLILWSEKNPAYVGGSKLCDNSHFTF